MSHTRLSIGRELLVAIIAVVLSVAVLPGVIYLVGTRLFGPYGGGNGVVGMYAATLGDLLAPSWAAWTIVLGPALCVIVLRLIFKLTQQNTSDEAPTRIIRKEPTIHG